MKPHHIWSHCDIATCLPDASSGYGLIRDGALVIQGDKLAWVGPRAQLPEIYQGPASVHHDAQGTLMTPGLIDCHTHLVYGGQRANEFELRLKGASYEEVARAGGGIVATVRATREADEASLAAQSARRLSALLKEGVTTVEIKSGYGLAFEHEAK